VTSEDKSDLHELRDATVDEQDKKLLRKTINYIQTLEAKLTTVRTLLQTAIKEASTR
jgi:hypothetical protein